MEAPISEDEGQRWRETINMLNQPEINIGSPIEIQQQEPWSENILPDQIAADTKSHYGSSDNLAIKEDENNLLVDQQDDPDLDYDSANNNNSHVERPNIDDESPSNMDDQNLFSDEESEKPAGSQGS